MYKLLTFIFVILICYSCGEDQMETKEIPDNFEIDLNQDGSFDFQITYEKLSASVPVDPDPGPVGIIRGKLESLNNNLILKSEEATSILFLNNIDLVQSEVNSPLFWESNSDGNSRIIVGINQNIDGETWPDEWKISNEEIKESYFVGFKLLDNNSQNLGFIELSIDNQTGVIEILNIEFI